VLIVDVEDMLRSVEKFVAAGRVTKVERSASAAVQRTRRRVLVVDDSLTVRELERKLLDQAGYEVEVAVDGMDGWNAVRAGKFDLVVTDIDMPRMDGIELVRSIKEDPNLAKLPVMIVSYKDREEDRRRGLDAGADYYLTKGSFHDDTLQQAVADLIGAANG
jgi:two-component system, chemotaxis family, sensor histidine kinase and response regulator WspE